MDGQGALDGRTAEWADAIRRVDINGDAFIEWDEFAALGRRHPELLDLMRSISWSDRRSAVFEPERVEIRKESTQILNRPPMA